MSGESPLVALSAIEKRYGQTRALAGAGIELHAGRVHAVVGENGAGKSTLLKIAGGVETADAGRVIVMGSPLVPATPREAIRRGVAMVHQHFMLVPTLTGLENLSLGDEPTRMGLLDLSAREKEIRALADELELPVRLDVPTESLSVGERQRLELLRALRTRPKVLILDEPTAVLAPREAESVLGLARKLADDGVAVALVTHHLDEVAAWSDEITVLRRGSIVAHHAPGDAAISDVHLIAREALGEDVPQIKRGAAHTGDVRLDIRGLHVSEGEGAPLRGLDLEIRAGEIVGVAGVEGNGQHALELALVGLAKVDSGTILFDGVDVTGATVRERRARGLAFIASDRHAHGIADLPAKDVIRLGALTEVSRSGVVDENALATAFAEAVSAFDIRPDAPEQLATSFSGGNQQKLVIGRELRGAPKLVVAAQPTRGVDLRAAMRIRRALLDIAKHGAAVLAISTDLDELRAVSTRIVVLRQGRVAAVLPPDAGLDRIGEAMMGAS